MEIDWSKPVTFNAAHPYFKVKAVRYEFGYSISSAHYRFTVNVFGEPFADLGSDFKIRNA